MNSETLGMISEAMEAMELNYNFMEYKVKAGEDPPQTYFVGEYQELDPDKESGEEESLFILTGFTREGWIRLENAKEKIKKYFPPSSGKVAAVGMNLTAAVFYTNSFMVPTGDAELKKIQINLTVKEWRMTE